MATGGGGDRPGLGLGLGPGAHAQVQSENKRTKKQAEAVEKKGPYIMNTAPTIQAKLQKHRELAKAVLRRKGILGGATLQQPKQASKSDGELESRGSSGYSSAEVNQDLNRQLLQDGYHLDEIPDDEDLDLIPPKPVASTCPCCFGESLPCTIQ
ncbi:protein FAM219B isoform X5 [Alligator mississippiensis]|uniref:protein FAM219B isoform X5 n=1 Tax=Alligator mississippiensis TaxID=8496 RepID=UPI0028779DA5|nr:protein FAM219B isoform X5 [Alligator mississippiensis]